MSHPPARRPCASHLPESLLPEGFDLPARTPPPPWGCRVRAVLWLQRAPSPLPSSAPLAGRVRPLVLGGFVDYLDSPVGPYREVLLGQLVRGSLLPVVTVPFLAVDSLTSLAGGREHWQLPKVLARFEGAGTASGDGWQVRADARPYGLRFPVRGPLGLDQGAGRSTTRLSGTARLARIDVSAEGLVLGPWIGAGTHPGLVAYGRMVVGGPTARSSAAGS